MLINVVVEGQAGQLDDSLLERRDTVDENDDYKAEAIEYWLNGVLVHRSAHVTMKRWPAMTAEAARL
jgi:hypothetical protein